MTRASVLAWLVASAACAGAPAPPPTATVEPVATAAPTPVASVDAAVSNVATPSACPASRDAVAAERTCTGDTTCVYGASRCVCVQPSPCQGIPPEPGQVLPRKWSCADPRTDGCPDAPPKDGSPCGAAQKCAYGSCGGTIHACENHRWRLDQLVGPPPSAPRGR